MNEMTPANVKSSIYIDFNAEKNDEDSQFKVGDLVRISKYKYIFAKSDTQNRLEEVREKVMNYMLNAKAIIIHLIRRTRTI